MSKRWSCLMADPQRLLCEGRRDFFLFFRQKLFFFSGRMGGKNHGEVTYVWGCFFFVGDVFFVAF